MSLVYIGLGTNLGEKERNLSDAIGMLSLKVGRVVSQSVFYKSKPWGFESGNEFLNAVVLVDTDLSPFDLLATTQKVEKGLGRAAKSVNGYSDRIIDIDILLYDDIVFDEPTLKIPHPLIVERDFVLVPLVEIAPDLVNPLTGIKYSEIILPE
jgi:2-amino-4-hydroxy-6-hydroxymethyldihydropteridine diphosphokinase